MAKSDLLKEAIADAKAVKETALANAKIALQEAFEPRIQSMLSAKLSEDLMEDEEDMEPIDDALPADNMGDMGNKQVDSDEMGSAEEEVDGLDVMIDDPATEKNPDWQGTVTEPMDDEEDVEGVAAPPEISDAEAATEYEEEGDDLGLDEIIAELEQNMEDEEEEEPEMAFEGSMYEDEEEVDYQTESIDDIINEILAEEEEEDPIEEAQIGAESIDDNGLNLELKESLNALEDSYKTIHHLKSVINEVNLLRKTSLHKQVIPQF